MNTGEFYKFNDDLIPMGKDLVGKDVYYLCVIKLKNSIKAGDVPARGGYKQKENGWDFDCLICNSCLANLYSPITNSELKKDWHQISRDEIIQLGKQERDIEPSTWDMKYFLKQVEK